MNHSTLHLLTPLLVLCLELLKPICLAAAETWHWWWWAREGRDLLFPRVNLNCKSLMFAAQHFGKAVRMLLLWMGPTWKFIFGFSLPCLQTFESAVLTMKSQREFSPCWLLICAGWDLSSSRLLMHHLVRRKVVLTGRWTSEFWCWSHHQKLMHKPDCYSACGTGWGGFPHSLDKLCPSWSYFIARK